MEPFCIGRHQAPDDSTAVRINDHQVTCLVTHSGNDQFFSLNLSKTMANLPVTINNFVQSPYAYWKELAWSGALLITLTVLALNVGARLLAAERTAK